MEEVTRKVVTWEQGIAVVGGAFGICCLGFMLLHGMIVSDGAEAMSLSMSLRTEVDTKIDRLADVFEAHRTSNEKDIKDIINGQNEILSVIKK